MNKFKLGNKKVCCKNCKYFVPAGDNIDYDAGTGGWWDAYCDYKEIEYIQEDDIVYGTRVYKKIKNLKLNYEYENRNHDCKYFIQRTFIDFCSTNFILLYHIILLILFTLGSLLIIIYQHL